MRSPGAEGDTREVTWAFADGSLGVHPADPDSLAAPERLHFLEAFANQIALAVE
jgi:hypothetical protein